MHFPSPELLFIQHYLIVYPLRGVKLFQTICWAVPVRENLQVLVAGLVLSSGPARLEALSDSFRSRHWSPVCPWIHLISHQAFRLFIGSQRLIEDDLRLNGLGLGFRSRIVIALYIRVSLLSLSEIDIDKLLANF